ncbi:MAG: transposase [Candidatus Azotimanducaceae bacterium]|jgi:transposase
MLFPEGNVRVWLHTEPTNMRRSFNGLSGMIKNQLLEDPLSGQLFVFVNRRRTQVKVLSTPKPQKHVDLQSANLLLENENASLKRQLAWFQKQMFGVKSERRLVDDNPDQLFLEDLLGDPVKPKVIETETITYVRGKAKKNRGSDCVTGSGLRFDDSVPVEVIEAESLELTGPEADQCEVIGMKSLHLLAQRPASLVVLRYDQPVVKRKGSHEIFTPAGVFDRSLADVTFLAGMLIDNFMYHMPLYRQHQRLAHAGINLSRATLTNLGKRSIELLRPIVASQLCHVLQSKILAMDETPVKAGRSGKGKMKTGWFWPVLGDQDEVFFTFANTRAKSHIEKILAVYFKGTLITDGYTAYAGFTKARDDVVHAQCWVHSRRDNKEARACG